MGSRVIPAETSGSERVPCMVAMGWKLEVRVWRSGSNPGHTVIMARTLWPGRVLKTPSQIHPDLGTRWSTYVSIASGDASPDLG